MDDNLRAHIRHLYFVDRIAPRAIAQLLALSPQAVRSTLVLLGGAAAPTSPAPVSAALAAPESDPASRATSTPRRAAQMHR